MKECFDGRLPFPNPTQVNDSRGCPLTTGCPFLAIGCREGGDQGERDDAELRPASPVIPSVGFLPI